MSIVVGSRRGLVKLCACLLAQLLVLSVSCVSAGQESQPPQTPVQNPGGAPSSGQQPSPPAAGATVTGTVTYRERIALPDNAVVQVMLQDISRADAPAVLLGEQTIETGGRQVPIPFTITYDPAQIDQRMTYAVRASITVDDLLLFTSTTAILVISQGRPTTVEIVVERA